VRPDTCFLPKNILIDRDMSRRIRRHVDPFQCRFTITIDDWSERYSPHREKDIWLDLGCGKGEFLAGLAEDNPNLFFIGIEVRRRITDRYFPKYKHLPNLLLLHGNVNLSIPSMMGHQKVQRVFINFPDPYDYKARYKKRQMVNERLVEGLCEILAPGGITSVRTDNRTLFEEMDALLSEHLQPIPPSADTSSGQIVLTEWENECRNKSVRVYSREYELK
jgi:tRNA (guanine-N7-)-methyltransferase